jgi:hypothetical protein
MLTSERGKEMLSHCPRYYQASRVFKSIMQASGVELDSLKQGIEEILDQFFVNTATWGLDLWEQELGLSSFVGKPLNQRRSTVLSRLGQPNMATVNFIKRIAEIFGGTVEVVQTPAAYSFTVKFVQLLNASLNLADVRVVLEEIKPAHIGLNMIVVEIGASELTVKIDLKGYLFPYIPCNTLLCGLHPRIATIGKILASVLGIATGWERYVFNYPLAGVHPRPATIGKILASGLNIAAQFNSYRFDYPPCGTLFCGTYP